VTIHDFYAPPDWTMVQWHPDPAGRRYRDLDAARRAANWLNTNHHDCEAWLFRAVDDPRCKPYLERRWIGAEEDPLVPR